MDTKGIAGKIEKEFELAMKADKGIASLYNKVSAGKATYEEAGKFASMSGQHIGNILANNIDDVITAEEALELIPPALRKNYDYVSEVTAEIQRTLNKKAGVGLNPIVPDMDEQRATTIANDYAEVQSKEVLIKECENASRKIVDESAQKNAAAQSSAGMQVLVTREYDDVGVHDGKDVCEWCLSRCGTDMTYQEAYSIGAFERHPGCGCIITYTSRKGTVTQQTQAGGYWQEIQPRRRR